MEELRLLIIQLYNDSKNRDEGLNYEEFNEIFATN